MAMFGTYFDDSKMPSKTPAVLSMGCYIASDAQWAGFVPRWTALLRSKGVCHLRMADLNNKYGEFAGWDKECEKEFLRQAHVILKECTEGSVVASVDLRAYRKIVPAAAERFWGGPHGYCMFKCLLRMAHDNDPERIACLYEINTDYEREINILKTQIVKHGAAALLLKNIPIKTWTSASKDDFPQFDSGDVIAYEATKHWYNKWFSPTSIPTRKSLQSVLRYDEGDKDFGTFCGEAELRHDVENLLDALPDLGTC